MKHTAILIMLGLFLAPLCAQEKPPAEKLKLAAEVIELNGTGQNLKRAIDSHSRKCEALMEKYLSRAEDRKAAEKVKNELRAVIKDEMDPAELQAETARIYAERFTLDELKAITAFYHSPAGQKMLLLNPDLTGQINDLLRSHSRAVDQKAAEILKRKVSAQVPAEAHFVPVGKIPAQSQESK